MNGERKEAERATPEKPRPPWFEAVAVVLLSLATVGTAWCSYQAAVWSSVSQRNMNLSANHSRRAVADQLKAYQVATVDILLFSQYINAHADSNQALMRFYSDRFRGEAKIAFDAWLTTHPFENPNAPPHPFVTNFYRPRALFDAGWAEEESDRLWQRAGEAGKSARNYILVTVLLASALFCGGTAPKFEGRWVRRVVLALGLGVFLIAVTRLWMLPVQL